MLRVKKEVQIKLFTEEAKDAEIVDVIRTRSIYPFNTQQLKAC